MTNFLIDAPNFIADALQKAVSVFMRTEIHFDTRKTVYLFDPELTFGDMSSENYLGYENYKKIIDACLTEFQDPHNYERKKMLMLFYPKILFDFYNFTIKNLIKGSTDEQPFYRALKLLTYSLFEWFNSISQYEINRNNDDLELLLGSVVGSLVIRSFGALQSVILDIEKKSLFDSGLKEIQIKADSHVKRIQMGSIPVDLSFTPPHTTRLGPFEDGVHDEEIEARKVHFAISFYIVVEQLICMWCAEDIQLSNLYWYMTIRNLVYFPLLMYMSAYDYVADVPKYGYLISLTAVMKTSANLFRGENLYEKMYFTLAQSHFYNSICNVFNVLTTNGAYLPHIMSLVGAVYALPYGSSLTMKWLFSRPYRADHFEENLRIQNVFSAVHSFEYSIPKTKYLTMFIIMTTAVVQYTSWSMQMNPEELLITNLDGISYGTLLSSHDVALIVPPQFPKVSNLTDAVNNGTDPISKQFRHFLRENSGTSYDLVLVGQRRLELYDSITYPKKEIIKKIYDILENNPFSFIIEEFEPFLHSRGPKTKQK
jgi:hypothetical protein